MNHKMYIPRSGLKKPTIPDLLNQTNISEQKDNCDQNQDKSDFEKYLNFYQSIQKKETPYNKENISCYNWKGKKCTQVKKGIFSNRLIQNSCPKIPREELQYLLNEYNQERKGIARIEIINERLKSVPSKKNEMALKMIAQNKISPDGYQNINNNEQININVRGILIQTQNGKNTDKFYYNIHQDQPDETHQTQSCWKGNSFVGFNVQKTYIGYFKAKNKKKYSKEQERRLRNSTAFINQINRSIQKKKNTKMINRPQTCHIKGRDFLRQVGIESNHFSPIQFCGYENQEKMLKIQSEAKLRSFQNNPSLMNNVQNNNCQRIGRKQQTKTTNHVRFSSNVKQMRSVEKKNNKINPFHSRIHQFSKNQSFHAELSKFTDKDRNLLLKKCLRKTSTGGQYNKYLPINDSLQRSRIQRRSHQITLNKIQESIQKDIQIIIQQINVKR